MSEMMRAGRIVEPGKLEVAEVERPAAPGAHEVLMKVKMVGVCGSDVHIFKGENPFATYPRVFGHEFVGEVAAVGSEVTNVKVGDHIVGEPISYCGKCYACTHGSPNVCEHLEVMGVHRDGGCREYLLLDDDKAHVIDPTVPWNVAVLTEPLTIGFQSTSRANVMPGDVVLVMGSGTIGLTIMLAAKAKGATVIMTDIVDAKLEYAKSLGADYGVNVLKESLEDRIREITGTMGPNVVLDCVCNKASLEQAVDLVSPAGRVVELGFGPIKSEIPHAVVMKKEVTILGTRLQSHKFPEAVKLVEEKREALADFVTQQYDIEHVNDAFKFAIEHPAEVRKVIVAF